MADTKISALTASTTPLAGTEVLPIVQSSTTKKVSVANLTAGRAMSALSGSFGTGTPALGISGTQVGITNTSANTYLSVYAGAGAATQGGFLIGANNTENQANILWVESGNYLQISANPASSTLKMIAGGATSGTFQSTGLAMPNGLGIDFSATPGTGTSELLADYEEGTWTPTYVSSGATFGYTQQYGSYVKVGKLVYAQFYLNVTASGTTTNQVTISGLPFTSSSVNTPYEQGFGGAWSTNIQPIAFTVDANATTVTLWKQNAAPGIAIALNVVGYQVGTLIYRSA